MQQVMKVHDYSFLVMIMPLPVQYIFRADITSLLIRSVDAVNVLTWLTPSTMCFLLTSRSHTLPSNIADRVFFFSQCPSLVLKRNFSACVSTARRQYLQMLSRLQQSHCHDMTVLCHGQSSFVVLFTAAAMISGLNDV